MNSCRILVGLYCNYSCSYCCNKNQLSGKPMLGHFKKISLEDMAEKVREYDEVCISGGEPLLPANIETTLILARRAKKAKAKVFLYTNGSVPINFSVLECLDGINLGYHPTQIHRADFAEMVLHRWNFNMTRILGEVEPLKELIPLLGSEFHGTTKSWIRDECDMRSKEDWFIISKNKDSK